MKQKLVPIMLRFEPEHAAKLRDDAHARRLPVAVFVKELVLNRMPAIAPPSIDDLSPEGRQLLTIAHAGVSNLSQLSDHSNRLQGQFLKLIGPLEKLREAVRLLGLDVKSGALCQAKIEGLLSRLKGPSNSLNLLAQSLNSGEACSGQQWYDVLTILQNSLPKLSAQGGGNV